MSRLWEHSSIPSWHPYLADSPAVCPAVSATRCTISLPSAQATLPMPRTAKVKKSKTTAQTNGNGIAALTAQLWQATVNLRGSIEPAGYNRYVLPIIFLRFLSLRYERRRAELERLIADPASEYYTTDPRVAADIPVAYQQGAGAPFAITGILPNDSEEERRQDGVYARLSANLATSSRLRNSETRPPSAA